MNSEWTTYKIRDLGRIVTGKTPPTSNPAFSGTDVPFVTPSDFVGNKWIKRTTRSISYAGAQSVKNCQIPAGAIVVTCIGSDMGKAALVASPCVTNQQINAIITDKEQFSSEFVYYNLSLRKAEIRGLAGGSAQPILSKAGFGDLPIVCPSLSTQKSIVNLLRPLDEKIALLGETNATLYAIAQALFKSWFVDFDPVRAKAEGREQEGINAETAGLFPDAFVQAQVGLVPKGWEIKTLEDLLVLQRGFDLPSDQRVPGDYPIIAASGPSGTHATAMAKGPGVITGRSGVIGRVFLELDDYWPLNTALWVKEFRAATPCYAYELLKRMDLASFNAGSAVPTLNRNHVHSLPCVVPPAELVSAYEATALSLHKRARENAKQAETLATIRDVLLPRLISGQLRLPEAKALLRDAA